MAGDRIIDPAAIALSLRRLVDSVPGLGTPATVVGVPGGITLRNISVPPVPDAELPMVVEAEVEHQGMIRHRGSAYSFLKLWSPVDHERAHESVVVMAVDDDVTSRLRSAIERANLEVEAFEPSQYGMYRAVRLAAGANSTFCALLMGTANAELAFVNQGKLLAYRRVETGSLALMREANTGTVAAPAAGSTPTSTTADEGVSLSVTALDTLGTDCYRALDYFTREYPDLAAVDRMYLAIDRPELRQLEMEMTHRLGIPVEQVKLENFEGGANVVDGSKYIAAYGLAMRDIAPIALQVPRLDLFSKERTATQQIRTRRNFAGSIIISATAILLGLAFYFLYGSQIADLQEATKQQKQQAAEVRSETDKTVKERARRTAQYLALRKEGVPVTALLDYIAGALQPGVGISSVSISDDLKVTIQGDAVDEPAMIGTVQFLQQCPLLPGLIIDSFSRVKDKEGITFQLSSTTVPLSRVHMAGEKEVGK
jgi:Tfp pilus assembly PilM family ATPase